MQVIPMFGKTSSYTKSLLNHDICIKWLSVVVRDWSILTSNHL